ncbi:MAG TPA: glycoside hydrolase family 97 C-terminal domain-containing protein, partial [Chitinophagaceae bacterium]|nr:glycoside hydrolase family 97 C-terminal domain-containing protein [Chitinophagaceae bacterium]
ARPLMLGTRCHMLGLYVVFENYLQMVCDYPAAYEGQEGFDFVKKVPTVWDETKVLDGKLREFISIARRKDNDWYVGAVTNHSARNIDISLNFLPEGKYLAEIYTDADDVATNPNNLDTRTLVVTNKDVVPARLAAGGGLAIHFKKQVGE